MTGREDRRRSQVRMLAGFVPLALVVAILMPTSASAQGPANCVGELTEDSENSATLQFQCSFAIDDPQGNSLSIASNKDVLLRPGQGENGGGYLCVPPAAEGPAQDQGEPNNFGPPTSCGADIEANEEVTGGVFGENVCDPLELRITAGIREQQTTFDVEIEGCPRDGDGPGDDDGDDPDEDEGQVPRGGVQSGAGGTAGAGGPSPGLLALGGLLLAATLGFGIARVRGSA